MIDSCANEFGVGDSIFALVSRLWPFNRSLTGNGVRETLFEIRRLLPCLQIHEVPSGTKVFDWTVPNEWNVRDAWIEAPDGCRVVDFAENNLCLVGYSVPMDVILSLDELQQYLHSLPDQPDAIPYTTSYYSPRWGFCIRDSDRLKLKPGNYRIHIDTSLEPGYLTYGEILIKGETAEEVFLSTYICHPSMANNELSGPCVTAYLAKWLSEKEKLRYTYRLVFIPETIGSITYLSRHIEYLKQHVIAGFVVTCVGDDRCYSYLPSRYGNTLSDKAALHVLKHHASDFIRYSYLDRGSDERQYCAPGVDLPIATIMRSKYGEYPEYHTSLDDLNLVTPAGLKGGYTAIRRAIESIEQNVYLKVTVYGEPQLGKRGLYPTLSTKSSGDQVKSMMNLISYCDGSLTLLEIANLIDEPMWELLPIVEKLVAHGLLEQKYLKINN
jgi:aminopeptidase-like protein